MIRKLAEEDPDESSDTDKKGMINKKICSICCRTFAQSLASQVNGTDIVSLLVQLMTCLFKFSNMIVFLTHLMYK